MKTFLKIMSTALTAFAITSPAIASQAEDALVGTYQYRPSGAWEEVARVYVYQGALRLKVANGCSAELVQTAKNVWSSSCKIGSGYSQVIYKVRVYTAKNFSPRLEMDILEADGPSTISALKKM